MRTTVKLRSPLLAVFTLILSLLPFAAAHAITPAELVQVQASRVTSSLMLLRGEGFQSKHLETLEADLQSLSAAISALPQPSAELNKAHQDLVSKIRQGVAFGPKEEDMPWRYPEELSRALLEVLNAARKLGESDDQESVAKLEYLSTQYLSRAYFGNFEIAREEPDAYVGQDEREIVPAIDAYMAQLDGKNNPQVGKLKTRWDYLKAALVDLNSQSNTLQSASGRPFAPTTVQRHTRALSNQWMQLDI
ncbi:hypothetical protein [Pseudomonas sp. 5P_3.1_Bac2]|uniref:hypothetical protein n=1 Tax=Pseudomonas sp. 5P_3.1_Bac2 TaxID=2971617 RepID=UPI0021C6547F|nr:hypothetical protein [Pseudomonas sp. 5P_3.1_Bac2]MCU1719085.1 hypothetical protein [Pseudomonas sp. 5P_3.1_Bac2]